MTTTNNACNWYEKVLTFYDKIPKSVLAAIAVSYALRDVDRDFSKVDSEIKKEWVALYKNGIVPQKPIK